MPRCIERRDISLQRPFIFIKEKSIPSCANQFMHIIASGFSLIYASVFQLLFGCAYMARKQYQYTYGTMTALTEKVGTFFKKRQESPEKESVQGSLTLQIQNAYQFHQQELTALNYIRRLRAIQTIGVIQWSINSFQNLLIQKEYRYSDQLTPHQLQSFLEAIQKLNRFLDEKENTLKKDETNKDIKRDIKDIFEHIHAFHSALKEIGAQLSKSSPEKKQFIKLCNILAEHVNKQQKIHRNPSFDPYLYNLQQNEKKARMLLQTLYP